MNFEDLKGKIFTAIVTNKEEDTIVFEDIDGRTYKMEHFQDYSESVYIEDICGNMSDLLNTPILLAEEVCSDEHPEGLEGLGEHTDSFTWSFYKLSTIRGTVTIRWFGESNGYYSETVDIGEIT